ncbi:D-alanyl-D-alanine carboxypeptidase [Lipingzhangella halophila]|uniref:D-alanyl-D-alanine carboxypeptidase n=1 Tax=Lipingzhangella halophila TaxID=1783352 RepID=A0A7W7RQ31_9ACTN|nr:serine hydrolase domain-containing protein [Lipingzhangella halophila]MBB4935486.1 D-alanyl-D-alanine carboxypeptidase [Lipingzhangella halophila]
MRHGLGSMTRRGTATAVAAGLALGLAQVPAQADKGGPPRSKEIRAHMDELVSSEAATAIIARTGGGKKEWSGSAGVSDLESGGPADPEGHFRIGSNTKTFVATVLLQLVDEGALSLDDPVERHLPGTVPNGEAITVRQILNHTSGLYNYSSVPGYEIGSWRGDDRFTTYHPEELLGAAFENDPYFEPGEGWHYSNTNFIVSGMLIERLTGNAYGDEIRARILDPLDLNDTSLPGTDHTLPDPHARGYTPVEGEGYRDATEYNPSIGWAAGEMISTTADLGRFLTALLGGDLMSSESLEAMKDTVDTGGEDSAYGLGLIEYKLDCGESVFGHGGTEVAYVSGMTQAEDGRQFVYAASLHKLENAPPGARDALLDAAYCPPDHPGEGKPGRPGK